MNAWAVRAWLALAVLLAVLYAGWVSYRIERSTALADAPSEPADSDDSGHARQVDDFTLTDQAGREFGTAQLRREVWVASFFFASCPATCRQLNTSLAAVQRDLPADVQFVSITCDPDNDDPATLTRYAKLFDADYRRWKFLTGDMKDLQRVGRNIFQVALEKGTHSEKSFVVDRAGRIRGRFNMLDPDQVKKLTALVKKLAAEPADGTAAPPAEDAPPGPRGAEDREQTEGEEAEPQKLQPPPDETHAARQHDPALTHGHIALAADGRSERAA